ncbi:hypothetical protein RCL1_001711 [Eukaryota sp. TZLM3-RCL]
MTSPRNDMRQRLRNLLASNPSNVETSPNVIELTEIALFFESELTHLEAQNDTLKQKLSTSLSETQVLRSQTSSHSSSPKSSFLSSLSSDDLNKMSAKLEKSLLALEEDISRYSRTLLPYSKAEQVSINLLNDDVIGSERVLNLIDLKMNSLEKFIFILKQKVASFEGNTALSRVISEFNSVDNLIKNNEELKKEVEFLREREARFNVDGLLRRVINPEPIIYDELDTSSAQNKLIESENRAQFLTRLVCALQNELIGHVESRNSLLERLSSFSPCDTCHDVINQIFEPSELTGSLENSVYELIHTCTSEPSDEQIQSKFLESQARNFELLDKSLIVQRLVSLENERKSLSNMIETVQITSNSKKSELLTRQNFALLSQLRTANGLLKSRDEMIAQLEELNQQLTAQKSKLMTFADQKCLELSEMKRLSELISTKSLRVNEQFKTCFSISLSLIELISGRIPSNLSGQELSDLLSSLTRHDDDFLPLLNDLMSTLVANDDKNSEIVRHFLTSIKSDLIERFNTQINSELLAFKSLCFDSCSLISKFSDQILNGSKLSRHVQATVDRDVVERCIQYEEEEVAVPTSASKTKKSK